MLRKSILNGEKIKKSVCISAVIYFIASMLISPSHSINAAKNALALCANVLIPSLFPFFVFSGLLVGFGFAHVLSRPMSHIMRPVFGVSGAGALCLILGVVSGYPLGASCVCDMYKSGALTKNEAEKLLAFCNNSGPLFIIGSVGAAMYFSEDIGIMLYTVHVLSALSTGVIVGIFGRKGKKTEIPSTAIQCTRPVGMIIKQTVVNSVSNMLLVCGFTVLFAVIIRSVPTDEGGLISLLAGGVLEISTGIYNVSISQLALCEKLILTSAIAGFAGISVHLQVVGIVSGTDLSTRRYFAGKIMQSALAAVYTSFALRYMAAYAYAPAPLLSPVEIMDFGAALKLTFLYMAAAMITMLLFAVAEKIYVWQKSVKHK